MKHVFSKLTERSKTPIKKNKHKKTKSSLTSSVKPNNLISKKTMGISHKKHNSILKPYRTIQNSATTESKFKNFYLQVLNESSQKKESPQEHTLKRIRNNYQSVCSHVKFSDYIAQPLNNLTNYHPKEATKIMNDQNNSGQIEELAKQIKQKNGLIKELQVIVQDYQSKTNNIFKVINVLEQKVQELTIQNDLLRGLTRNEQGNRPRLY